MTNEAQTTRRKMSKPTKQALYDLLKSVATDPGSPSLDGALYNDIVNALNSAGISAEADEPVEENGEDEKILD